MAYDRELADRIRHALASEHGITERRMFGGSAFLLHGNMALAASAHGGLLVRVDPDEAEAWIDGKRVTPMVMRGRAMRGWLRVDCHADDPDVEQWVARGLARAGALAPKRP